MLLYESADPKLLASRLWCGIDSPSDNSRSFPGVRQGLTAALDTIGGSALQSRRHLRAGRAGARLRGRRRPDRALRSVHKPRRGRGGQRQGGGNRQGKGTEGKGEGEGSTRDLGEFDDFGYR